MTALPQGKLLRSLRAHTLQRLLAMPDEKRRALVHSWVTGLLTQDVPRDFVEAIACLHDDAVAEKAYEVIFHCRR